MIYWDGLSDPVFPRDYTQTKIIIRILYHRRYARANTGIQFFDKDSLLPPPFTFLSILVKAFTFISDTRRTKGNAAR